MSNPVRVLIADEMSSEAERILRTGGLTVDVVTGKTPQELQAIIAPYHGLAVRSASKVTADVLGAASNLKIIGRAGVGVDNIDVRAATAKRIRVVNTPAGNAIAAAELTIAYLFALARKLPQSTASMKAGKWDKKSFLGIEITGKTLGIVGLGNIGRQVAERAIGLKMKVLAYDPLLPADAKVPAGIELLPLDALTSRADFVTLHVPLVDGTRGMFGRDTLLRMKKGAYLINCARGGIVDEKALYEVLKAGHLAGAALDVFENEPCGLLPLFELDNVLASPHIGASTEEAQVKVAIELAEVFVDFFRSGQARNVVNAVA